MTNEMAAAKKTDKPSSTYAATNNTIADGPAPQSNNLRADGPEMTDDEKTLRRIFLAAGAVPVVKLTDIRASGGSSKGHKMTVTELTQHKFKQLCDLAAAKGWGSADPMASPPPAHSVLDTSRRASRRKLKAKLKGNTTAGRRWVSRKHRTLTWVRCLVRSSRT